MNLSEIFKWSNTVESHIRAGKKEGSIFEIFLASKALEKLSEELSDGSINDQIRKMRTQYIDLRIETATAASKALEKNHFKHWLEPNNLTVIMNQSAQHAINHINKTMESYERTVIARLKNNDTSVNKQGKMFLLKHAKRALKQAEKTGNFDTMSHAIDTMQVYIKKETDEKMIEKAKFAKELIATAQQILEDRHNISNMLSEELTYTPREGLKWGQTFLKEASENLEKQVYALTQN